MANQTITQLPTADALTGTELVPIVQDGGTVKTTVADIAAVPVTNYSFVTATSEGSLSQSRQLSTSGGGLTLTDNGAGSTLVLSLSGAPASLVTAGTGIQAIQRCHFPAWFSTWRSLQALDSYRVPVPTALALSRSRARLMRLM
jgi:hypothetical protein